MTFLSTILLWTTLYFAWEARANQRMWEDCEAECDALRAALHRGGELVAEANDIVEKSMGTIVNLARAHTIICDLHGEEVHDGIREMCGREYDQYVDDDWE